MNHNNKLCNQILAVLVLLTLLGVGIAQAETPLEGAWLGTSFTDADGNTNDSPQPALYIFTTTHYSIMIARGDEPRSGRLVTRLSASSEMVARLASSCRGCDGGDAWSFLVDAPETRDRAPARGTSG